MTIAQVVKTRPLMMDLCGISFPCGTIVRVVS